MAEIAADTDTASSADTTSEHASGRAYYLPEPPVGAVLPADSGPHWEYFRATEDTVSSWGTHLQHGAPPSALLTRALERAGAAADAATGDAATKRLTRITVELLGAVPVGQVRVRGWVERPGRAIELTGAVLEGQDASGGWRAAARAWGWRMATVDTSEIEVAVDPALAPRSEGTPADFGQLWGGGYIASLEFVAYPDRDAAGNNRVWARAKLPLVRGEQSSPIVTAMTVIDSANGIGAPVDPRRWQFMNTDLTVHFHRVPRGDWVGVAAAGSVGPDGVGMAAAVISDEWGAYARSQQTLLVRPQPQG